MNLTGHEHTCEINIDTHTRTHNHLDFFFWLTDMYFCTVHTNIYTSVRVTVSNLRVSIVPDNALRIWCTLQDTGGGGGGGEEKISCYCQSRGWVREKAAEREHRIAHCQRRKSDAAWMTVRSKQTMKEKDWDRRQEGEMEKESLSEDSAANSCFCCCSRREKKVHEL